ncbi:MAG: hypothetical protein HY515_03665, partial [Candidatus Aenigmarchaeota archaeon]|nr:hypothetical protein [Candidatus Aenigmarchaeota archaeon]
NGQMRVIETLIDSRVGFVDLQNLTAHQTDGRQIAHATINRANGVVTIGDDSIHTLRQVTTIENLGPDENFTRALFAHAGIMEGIHHFVNGHMRFLEYWSGLEVVYADLSDSKAAALDNSDKVFGLYDSYGKKLGFGVVDFGAGEVLGYQNLAGEYFVRSDTQGFEAVGIVKSNSYEAWITPLLIAEHQATISRWTARLNNAKGDDKFIKVAQARIDKEKQAIRDLNLGKMPESFETVLTSGESAIVHVTATDMIDNSAGQLSQLELTRAVIVMTMFGAQINPQTLEIGSTTFALTDMNGNPIAGYKGSVFHDRFFLTSNGGESHSMLRLNNSGGLEFFDYSVEHINPSMKFAREDYGMTGSALMKMLETSGQLHETTLPMFARLFNLDINDENTTNEFEYRWQGDLIMRESQRAVIFEAGYHVNASPDDLSIAALFATGNSYLGTVISVPTGMVENAKGTWDQKFTWQEFSRIRDDDKSGRTVGLTSLQSGMSHVLKWANGSDIPEFASMDFRSGQITLQQFSKMTGRTGLALPGYEEVNAFGIQFEHVRLILGSDGRLASVSRPEYVANKPADMQSKLDQGLIDLNQEFVIAYSPNAKGYVTQLGFGASSLMVPFINNPSSWSDLKAAHAYEYERAHPGEKLEGDALNKLVRNRISSGESFQGAIKTWQEWVIEKGGYVAARNFTNFASVISGTSELSALQQDAFLLGAKLDASIDNGIARFVRDTPGCLMWGDDYQREVADAYRLAIGARVGFYDVKTDPQTVTLQTMSTIVDQYIKQTSGTAVQGLLSITLDKDKTFNSAYTYKILSLEENGFAGINGANVATAIAHSQGVRAVSLDELGEHVNLEFAKSFTVSFNGTIDQNTGTIPAKTLFESFAVSGAFAFGDLNETQQQLLFGTPVRFRESGAFARFIELEYGKAFSGADQFGHDYTYEYGTLAANLARESGLSQSVVNEILSDAHKTYRGNNRGGWNGVRDAVVAAINNKLVSDGTAGEHYYFSPDTSVQMTLFTVHDANEAGLSVTVPAMSAIARASQSNIDEAGFYQISTGYSAPFLGFIGGGYSLDKVAKYGNHGRFLETGIVTDGIVAGGFAFRHSNGMLDFASGPGETAWLNEDGVLRLDGKYHGSSLGSRIRDLYVGPSAALVSQTYHFDLVNGITTMEYHSAGAEAGKTFFERLTPAGMIQTWHESSTAYKWYMGVSALVAAVGGLVILTTGALGVGGAAAGTFKAASLTGAWYIGAAGVSGGVMVGSTYLAHGRVLSMRDSRGDLTIEEINRIAAKDSVLNFNLKTINYALNSMIIFGTWNIGAGLMNAGTLRSALAVKVGSQGFVRSVFATARPGLVGLGLRAAVGFGKGVTAVGKVITFPFRWLANNFARISVQASQLTKAQMRILIQNGAKITRAFAKNAGVGTGGYFIEFSGNSAVRVFLRQITSGRYFLGQAIYIGVNLPFVLNTAAHAIADVRSVLGFKNASIESIMLSKGGRWFSPSGIIKEIRLMFAGMRQGSGLGQFVQTYSTPEGILQMALFIGVFHVFAIAPNVFANSLRAGFVKVWDLLKLKVGGALVGDIGGWIGNTLGVSLAGRDAAFVTAMFGAVRGIGRVIGRIWESRFISGIWEEGIKEPVLGNILLGWLPSSLREIAVEFFDVARGRAHFNVNAQLNAFQHHVQTAHTAIAEVRHAVGVAKMTDAQKVNQFGTVQTADLFVLKAIGQLGSVEAAEQFLASGIIYKIESAAAILAGQASPIIISSLSPIAAVPTVAALPAVTPVIGAPSTRVTQLQQTVDRVRKMEAPFGSPSRTLEFIDLIETQIAILEGRASPMPTAIIQNHELVDYLTNLPSHQKAQIFSSVETADWFVANLMKQQAPAQTPIASVQRVIAEALHQFHSQNRSTGIRALDGALLSLGRIQTNSLLVVQKLSTYSTDLTHPWNMEVVNNMKVLLRENPFIEIDIEDFSGLQAVAALQTVAQTINSNASIADTVTAAALLGEVGFGRYSNAVVRALQSGQITYAQFLNVVHDLALASKNLVSIVEGTGISVSEQLFQNVAAARFIGVKEAQPFLKAIGISKPVFTAFGQLDDVAKLQFTSELSARSVSITPEAIRFLILGAQLKSIPAVVNASSVGAYLDRIQTVAEKLGVSKRAISTFLGLNFNLATQDEIQKFFIDQGHLAVFQNIGNLLIEAAGTFDLEKIGNYSQIFIAGGWLSTPGFAHDLNNSHVSPLLMQQIEQNPFLGRQIAIDLVSTTQTGRLARTPEAIANAINKFGLIRSTDQKVFVDILRTLGRTDPLASNLYQAVGAMQPELKTFDKFVGKLMESPQIVFLETGQLIGSLQAIVDRIVFVTNDGNAMEFISPPVKEKFGAEGLDALRSRESVVNRTPMYDRAHQMATQLIYEFFTMSGSLRPALVSAGVQSSVGDLAYVSPFFRTTPLGRVLNLLVNGFAVPVFETIWFQGLLPIFVGYEKASERFADAHKPAAFREFVAKIATAGAVGTFADFWRVHRAQHYEFAKRMGKLGLVGAMAEHIRNNVSVLTGSAKPGTILHSALGTYEAVDVFEPFSRSLASFDLATAALALELAQENGDVDPAIIDRSKTLLAVYKQLAAPLIKLTPEQWKIIAERKGLTRKLKIQLNLRNQLSALQAQGIEVPTVEEIQTAIYQFALRLQEGMIDLSFLSVSDDIQLPLTPEAQSAQPQSVQPADQSVLIRMGSLLDRMRPYQGWNQNGWRREAVDLLQAEFQEGLKSKGVNLEEVQDYMLHAAHAVTGLDLMILHLKLLYTASGDLETILSILQMIAEKGMWNQLSEEIKAELSEYIEYLVKAKVYAITSNSALSFDEKIKALNQLQDQLKQVKSKAASEEGSAVAVTLQGIDRGIQLLNEALEELQKPLPSAEHMGRLYEVRKQLALRIEEFQRQAELAQDPVVLEKLVRSIRTLTAGYREVDELLESELQAVRQAIQDRRVSRKDWVSKVGFELLDIDPVEAKPDEIADHYKLQFGEDAIVDAIAQDEDGGTFFKVITPAEKGEPRAQRVRIVDPQGQVIGEYTARRKTITGGRAIEWGTGYVDEKLTMNFDRNGNAKADAAALDGPEPPEFGKTLYFGKEGETIFLVPGGFRIVFESDGSLRSVESIRHDSKDPRMTPYRQRFRERQAELQKVEKRLSETGYKLDQLKQKNPADGQIDAYEKEITELKRRAEWLRGRIHKGVDIRTRRLQKLEGRLSKQLTESGGKLSELDEIKAAQLEELKHKKELDKAREDLEAMRMRRSEHEDADAQANREAQEQNVSKQEKKVSEKVAELEQKLNALFSSLQEKSGIREEAQILIIQLTLLEREIQNLKEMGKTINDDQVWDFKPGSNEAHVYQTAKTLLQGKDILGAVSLDTDIAKRSESVDPNTKKLALAKNLDEIAKRPFADRNRELRETGNNYGLRVKEDVYGIAVEFLIKTNQGNIDFRKKLIAFLRNLSGAKDSEISDDDLLKQTSKLIVEAMKEAKEFLRDDRNRFHKLGGRRQDNKKRAAFELIKFVETEVVKASKTSEIFRNSVAQAVRDLAHNDQVQTKIKSENFDENLLYQFAVGLTLAQWVFGKDHRVYRGIQLLEGLAMAQGKIIGVPTAQGKTILMTMRNVIKAFSGKLVINEEPEGRFVRNNLWGDQAAVYAAFGIETEGVWRDKMSDPNVIREKFARDERNPQHKVVYIGRDDLQFIFLEDQQQRPGQRPTLYEVGKYVFTVDEIDDAMMVPIDYINAEMGRRLNEDQIKTLQGILVMARALVNAKAGDKQVSIPMAHANDEYRYYQWLEHKFSAKSGEKLFTITKRQGHEGKWVLHFNGKKNKELLDGLYDIFSGQFSGSMASFMEAVELDNPGAMSPEAIDTSEGPRVAFEHLLQAALRMILTRTYNEDLRLRIAENDDGTVQTMGGDTVYELVVLGETGMEMPQREENFGATFWESLLFSHVREQNGVLLVQGDTQVSGKVHSLDLYMNKVARRRDGGYDLAGSSGTVVAEYEIQSIRGGDNRSRQDIAFVELLRKLKIIQKNENPIPFPTHMDRAREVLLPQFATSNQEAMDLLWKRIEQFETENPGTIIRIFFRNARMAQRYHEDFYGRYRDMLIGEWNKVFNTENPEVKRSIDRLTSLIDRLKENNGDQIKKQNIENEINTIFDRLVSSPGHFKNPQAASDPLVLEQIAQLRFDTLRVARFFLFDGSESQYLLDEARRNPDKDKPGGYLGGIVFGTPAVGRGIDYEAPDFDHAVRELIEQSARLGIKMGRELFTQFAPRFRAFLNLEETDIEGLKDDEITKLVFDALRGNFLKHRDLSQDGPRKELRKELHNLLSDLKGAAKLRVRFAAGNYGEFFGRPVLQAEQLFMTEQMFQRMGVAIDYGEFAINVGIADDLYKQEQQYSRSGRNEGIAHVMDIFVKDEDLDNIVAQGFSRQHGSPSMRHRSKEVRFRELLKEYDAIQKELDLELVGPRQNPSAIQRLQREIKMLSRELTNLYNEARIRKTETKAKKIFTDYQTARVEFIMNKIANRMQVQFLGPNGDGHVALYPYERALILELFELYEKGFVSKAILPRDQTVIIQGISFEVVRETGKNGKEVLGLRIADETWMAKGGRIDIEGILGFSVRRDGEKWVLEGDRENLVPWLETDSKGKRLVERNWLSRTANQIRGGEIQGNAQLLEKGLREGLTGLGVQNAKEKVNRFMRTYRKAGVPAFGYRASAQEMASAFLSERVPEAETFRDRFAKVLFKAMFDRYRDNVRTRPHEAKALLVKELRAIGIPVPSSIDLNGKVKDQEQAVVIQLEKQLMHYGSTAIDRDLLDLAVRRYNSNRLVRQNEIRYAQKWGNLGYWYYEEGVNEKAARKKADLLKVRLQQERRHKQSSFMENFAYAYIDQAKKNQADLRADDLEAQETLGRHLSRGRQRDVAEDSRGLEVGKILERLDGQFSGLSEQVARAVIDHHPETAKKGRKTQEESKTLRWMAKLGDFAKKELLLPAVKLLERTAIGVAGLVSVSGIAARRLGQLRRWLEAPGEMTQSQDVTADFAERSQTTVKVVRPSHQADEYRSATRVNVQISRPRRIKNKILPLTVPIAPVTNSVSVSTETVGERVHKTVTVDSQSGHLEAAQALQAFGKLNGYTVDSSPAVYTVILNYAQPPDDEDKKQTGGADSITFEDLSEEEMRALLEDPTGLQDVLAWKVGAKFTAKGHQFLLSERAEVEGGVVRGLGHFVILPLRNAPPELLEAVDPEARRLNQGLSRAQIVASNSEIVQIQHEGNNIKVVKTKDGGYAYVHQKAKLDNVHLSNGSYVGENVELANVKLGTDTVIRGGKNPHFKTIIGSMEGSVTVLGRSVFIDEAVQIEAGVSVGDRSRILPKRIIKRSGEQIIPTVIKAGSKIRHRVKIQGSLVNGTAEENVFIELSNFYGTAKAGSIVSEIHVRDGAQPMIVPEDQVAYFAGNRKGIRIISKSDYEAKLRKQIQPMPVLPRSRPMRFFFIIRMFLKHWANEGFNWIQEFYARGNIKRIKHAIRTEIFFKEMREDGGFLVEAASLTEDSLLKQLPYKGNVGNLKTHYRNFIALRKQAEEIEQSFRSLPPDQTEERQRLQKQFELIHIRMMNDLANLFKGETEEKRLEKAKILAQQFERIDQKLKNLDPNQRAKVLEQMRKYARSRATLLQRQETWQIWKKPVMVASAVVLSLVGIFVLAPFAVGALTGVSMGTGIGLMAVAVVGIGLSYLRYGNTVRNLGSALYHSKIMKKIRFIPRNLMDKKIPAGLEKIKDSKTVQSVIGRIKIGTKQLKNWWKELLSLRSYLNRMPTVAKVALVVGAVGVVIVIMPWAAALSGFAVKSGVTLIFSSWGVPIISFVVLSLLGMGTWFVISPPAWYLFGGKNLRIPGNLKTYAFRALSYLPWAGKPVAGRYVWKRLIQLNESATDRYLIPHMIALAPGNKPTHGQIWSAFRIALAHEAQMKLQSNRRVQEKIKKYEESRNKKLKKLEEKVGYTGIVQGYQRYHQLRTRLDDLIESLEEVDLDSSVQKKRRGEIQEIQNQIIELLSDLARVNNHPVLMKRYAALKSQLSELTKILSTGVAVPSDAAYLKARMKSLNEQIQDLSEQISSAGGNLEENRRLDKIIDRFTETYRKMDRIRKAVKEEEFLEDFKTKDPTIRNAWTAFQIALWKRFADRLAKRTGKAKKEYEHVKKSARDQMLRNNPLETILRPEDVTTIAQQNGLSLAEAFNLMNQKWGGREVEWFMAAEMISANEIGLPSDYSLINTQEVSVEGRIRIGHALTELKQLKSQKGQIGVPELISVLKKHGVSLEDMDRDLGTLVLLQPYLEMSGMGNLSVSEGLALIQGTLNSNRRTAKQFRRAVAQVGIPFPLDGKLTESFLYELYEQMLQRKSITSEQKDILRVTLAEIVIRRATKKVELNRSLPKDAEDRTQREDILALLDQAERISPSVRPRILEFKRRHGLGFNDDTLAETLQQHVQELTPMLENKNVPPHIKNILKAHYEVMKQIKGIKVCAGLDTVATVSDDGQICFADWIMEDLLNVRYSSMGGPHLKEGIRLFVTAYLLHEGTEHGLSEFIGGADHPLKGLLSLAGSRRKLSSFELRAQQIRRRAQQEKTNIDVLEYDRRMMLADRIEEQGRVINEMLALGVRHDGKSSGSDDVQQLDRDILSEYVATSYFKLLPPESMEAYKTTWRSLAILRNQAIYRDKAAFYERAFGEGFQDDPVIRQINGDLDPWKTYHDYFKTNVAFQYYYDLEEALLNGQAGKAKQILKDKKRSSDQKRAEGQQPELAKPEYRALKRVVGMAGRGASGLAQAQNMIASRKTNKDRDLTYATGVYADREVRSFDENLQTYGMKELQSRNQLKPLPSFTKAEPNQFEKVKDEVTELLLSDEMGDQFDQKYDRLLEMAEPFLPPADVEKMRQVQSKRNRLKTRRDLIVARKLPGISTQSGGTETPRERAVRLVYNDVDQSYEGLSRLFAARVYTAIKPLYLRVYSDGAAYKLHEQFEAKQTERMERDIEKRVIHRMMIRQGISREKAQQERARILKEREDLWQKRIQKIRDGQAGLRRQLQAVEADISSISETGERILENGFRGFRNNADRPTGLDIPEGLFKHAKVAFLDPAKDDVLAQRLHELGRPVVPFVALLLDHEIWGYIEKVLGHEGAVAFAETMERFPENSPLRNSGIMLVKGTHSSLASVRSILIHEDTHLFDHLQPELAHQRDPVDGLVLTEVLREIKAYMPMVLSGERSWDDIISEFLSRMEKSYFGQYYEQLGIMDPSQRSLLRNRHEPMVKGMLQMVGVYSARMQHHPRLVMKLLDQAGSVEEFIDQALAVAAYFDVESVEAVKRFFDGKLTEVKALPSLPKPDLKAAFDSVAKYINDSNPQIRSAALAALLDHSEDSEVGRYVNETFAYANRKGKLMATSNAKDILEATRRFDDQLKTLRQEMASISDRVRSGTLTESGAQALRSALQERKEKLISDTLQAIAEGKQAPVLHRELNRYVVRINVSKPEDLLQDLEDMTSFPFEFAVARHVNANGDEKYYLTIGAFRHGAESYGREGLAGMFHTHPTRNGKAQMIPSGRATGDKKYWYDGIFQIRQGTFSYIGTTRTLTRYYQVDAQSAKRLRKHVQLNGTLNAIRKKADSYWEQGKLSFDALAEEKDGSMIHIEVRPWSQVEVGPNFFGIPKKPRVKQEKTKQSESQPSTKEESKPAIQAPKISTIQKVPLLTEVPVVVEGLTDQEEEQILPEIDKDLTTSGGEMYGQKKQEDAQEDAKMTRFDKAAEKAKSNARQKRERAQKTIAAVRAKGSGVPVTDVVLPEIHINLDVIQALLGNGVKETPTERLEEARRQLLGISKKLSRAISGTQGEQPNHILDLEARANRLFTEVEKELSSRSEVRHPVTTAKIGDLAIIPSEELRELGAPQVLT